MQELLSQIGLDFEWQLSVILALSTGYAILLLSMLVGLIKTPKRISNDQEISDWPKISVIVCAKNEQEHIQSCLDALSKLDYPKDLLKIIAVNDESTDSTQQIMEQKAQEDDRIIVLNTVDMPDSTLIAKGRAISWGMSKVDGDWVFLTDADSIVPSTWIKTLLSHSKIDTGLICGPLVIEDDQRLASKFERAIVSFAQMFSIGANGIGLSIAGMGANMAIRKELYDQLGGLESARPTLNDDLAMVIMCNNSKYKVLQISDGDALVRIKAVDSYLHLLSQQRRWFKGGIDQQQGYKFVLFFFFGLSFLFGLYIMFGWLYSVPLYLILMTKKLLVDTSYFWVQKKRFKLKNHLIYVLYLQVHLAIVFVMLFSSFLFINKVYWRGSGYAMEYK